MYHRALAAIGLSALVAIPAGSALAATATTTFNVTATVLDACTVAATDMVFGNYNPTGAATDGTSLVTVICTLSAPYNVRLAQGTNGTGVTARKMIRTSGTELLPYTLYRDTGRSLNWGITDGTDTVAATGTAIAQVHTVYGRIPAAAAVPAGLYTDSVTVTVNY